MATFSDRCWSDLVAALRSDHPELFRPWFARLTPTEMQHGVITVRAETAAHHQYLTQHCQAAFSAAAQKVTGRLLTVSFAAPPEAPAPAIDCVPTFELEGDSLRLNKDYTFDNFVTGPCNRLAHAACVAVGQNPGQTYNPLFIHGSVGLGKTHLLQATCQAILEGHPDARIQYLSCETFTNHFIEAIEKGALNQFRYRYRHVDVLVIDDIQFLATVERSREEFFHTFNTLFQAQRQIILSADEAPAGIPSLEDRLVSRFSWGLVARIDPPCLETRMAILRKKSRLRCLELPEEVNRFIAATVAGNTRELEGALTKVAAYSQQYGSAITLALAQEALADHVAPAVRPVGITEIMRLATEQFAVRMTDLQGKRRNRSVAFPRQVCMYLARQLTPLSLDEIGGYFGRRDHTTVLHAIQTIQARRDQDPELDRTLEGLIQTLRRAVA